MYIIQPLLTGSQLNNDGYNDLLNSIDRTIAKLAEGQYKNDVYGFQQYIDIDLYNKLCDYREILLDKLMGCNCLDNQYFILIQGRIKKLIC